MRERRRPTHTAYHEAGHAVACWALDVPITYATIIPTQDAAGHVRRGRVQPFGRHAVISFAGPAAQRRSHPHSDIAHGATDDQVVIDMTAEVLFAALHDRESYIRQADREARALVDKHWLAVDRVARGLMRHGAMSGFAIVPVIEGAEEEWRIVSAMNPGLGVMEHIRRQAVAAQGLPPLRRSHIEAAALRLGLAGTPVTETAIAADLTSRGYPEAAVRTLWSRIA